MEQHIFDGIAATITSMAGGGCGGKCLGAQIADKLYTLAAVEPVVGHSLGHSFSEEKKRKQNNLSE